MSTRCVLLSGFGETQLNLKEALRQSLSPYDVELVHASDLPAGVPVAKRISDALKRADCVIADISTMNPNILFDVGYASGRGVPVILLAEKGAGIPASLESSTIIPFDKGQSPSSEALEQLRSFLRTLGVPLRKAQVPRPSAGKVSSRISENAFGFLAAESAPSDSLRELFVEPPYFSGLIKFQTDVIEGQRGTGKTTLLQMMRARNALNLHGSQVAGFYVNFNEATHFLGSERSVLSDPWLFASYVNLLFLRSAVDELAHIRSLGYISVDEEGRLLGVLPKLYGRTATVSSLGQLSSLLTDVLYDLREKKPTDAVSYPMFLPHSFLGRFAGELRQRVKLFSERWPAFLLDDYATDWLRSDLVEALNSIIFQPSQNCCFKVATIPGRQNFSLGSGRVVTAAYDYRFFTTHFDARGRGLETRGQFASSIIDLRLQIAGSPLSAKLLLPSGQREEKGPHYSGMERLALLCEDDYRSLIRLCGRMIQEANGIDKPISPSLQDRVVLEVSSQWIKSLEGLPASSYSHEFLSAIMAFIQEVSSLAESSPAFGLDSRPVLYTGIAIRDPFQLSSEDMEKLLMLVRSGGLYPSASGSPVGKEQRFEVRKLLFPAFGVPVPLSQHFLIVSAIEASQMLHEPGPFWQRMRLKRLHS